MSYCKKDIHKMTEGIIAVNLCKQPATSHKCSHVVSLLSFSSKVFSNFLFDLFFYYAIFRINIAKFKSMWGFSGYLILWISD